jgi:hypothetical protein
MIPMPYRLAFLSALLFLCLTPGCAKKEQRYYWQRSPEAEFKSIRTYVVERNLESFFDQREQALGVNLRQEIESEIDKQMQAKGLTRAEAGRQADVVARFYGGLEETAMIDDTRPPPREVGRTPTPSMETRWVPVNAMRASERPADRREGRIVVEILNPRTGMGLWRGTAEDAIPKQAGADVAAKVREAVAGVMAQFPPP